MHNTLCEYKDVKGIIVIAFIIATLYVATSMLCSLMVAQPSVLLLLTVYSIPPLTPENIYIYIIINYIIKNKKNMIVGGRYIL